MPLYEYRCTSCGERLEVIQRVDAPAPGPCPSCGGSLEKLVSAPAIRFKGSGFYVNDYGRSGSGNGGSVKSDSSPSKDASSDAPAPKSDPKPATPAPTAKP